MGGMANTLIALGGDDFAPCPRTPPRLQIPLPLTHVLRTRQRVLEKDKTTKPVCGQVYRAIFMQFWYRTWDWAAL